MARSRPRFCLTNAAGNPEGRVGKSTVYICGRLLAMFWWRAPAHRGFNFLRSRSRAHRIGSKQRCRSTLHECRQSRNIETDTLQ
jgi:hypothetical protein